MQKRITRNGSATIEYACILAVVAAVLAAAVPNISPAFNAPLGDVAGAIDAQATGRSTTTGETSTIGTQQDNRFEMSSMTVRRSYLVEILLLGLVCILGVFVLRRVRRARMEFGFGVKAGDASVANVAASLLNKRQQIQLAISTHWHTSLSSQLVVAELMTPDPRSVGPDESRKELEESLKETGLHHVLVAKDGNLVGVISDRDIAERKGDTARDIMTPFPVTVTPKTLVTDAITVMLGNRASCLPVVRAGVLCGVVTASDIAMGLQCTLRVLDQIAAVIGTGGPATQRARTRAV